MEPMTAPTIVPVCLEDVLEVATDEEEGASVCATPRVSKEMVAPSVATV